MFYVLQMTFPSAMKLLVALTVVCLVTLALVSAAEGRVPQLSVLLVVSCSEKHIIYYYSL